jgi:hypothetical protein
VGDYENVIPLGCGKMHSDGKHTELCREVLSHSSEFKSEIGTVSSSETEVNFYQKIQGKMAVDGDLRN